MADVRNLVLVGNTGHIKGTSTKTLYLKIWSKITIDFCYYPSPCSREGIAFTHVCLKGKTENILRGNFSVSVSGSGLWNISGLFGYLCVYLNVFWYKVSRDLVFYYSHVTLFWYYTKETIHIISFEPIS